MTVPSVDPELLAEAVALARRAGEFTLGYFRDAGLAVDRKADGTPVTDADRGAERLLRDAIAQRHPGDGIVGEEEGQTQGDTGRRWIVDPIDGTKAFIRGVPTFSNLVAMEDEHGPAIGIINLPALGDTVYAGRGIGCFSTHGPARVSRRRQLTGSLLSTSGFEHWDEAPMLAVKRAGLQMRTWGDGYGFALVATGRIEAMADPEAAFYDLAAMPVILAEAGGRFSDWSGEATAGAGNGLATNGAIHQALLDLLTGGCA